jgi:hypothetical protein
MKELRILNINSADARSLVYDWDSYLYNVGCDIYIQGIYNRMTLTWDTSAPSTIHHIIDFVNDAFGDVWDIFELSKAIKHLKDDHVVIFDSDRGDVEIRTL